MGIKEQLIIKSTFLFLLLAIIVILVVGIYALIDNYYARTQYARMQWQFIKIKIDYLTDDFSRKKITLQEIFSPDKEIDKLEAKNIPSITVLLYHGVIEDPAWQPDGVNISQDDFKKQMFTLKKAGYETITLTDLFHFLKEEGSLPEKPILLTFDDARKDSFYTTDPILRALGYKAVMFVITNRSLSEGEKENNFHLSKNELKKMLSTGRWEFGSHTKDGHDLITVDRMGNRDIFLSNKKYIFEEGRPETDNEYLLRIQRDLAVSKNDLEEKLDISISTIAFPFGDYGQNSAPLPLVKDIILRETRKYYPLAFRQVENDEYPNNYSDGDKFLLKRLNVNSALSDQDLLFRLTSNKEKDLPFEDDFYNNKGWFIGWGNALIKNQSLTVGSPDQDPNNLIFLAGTYLWRNYHLKTYLKILKGDAFFCGSTL